MSEDKKNPKAAATKKANAAKRKRIDATERVEVTFNDKSKHIKAGTKKYVHPELAKAFKEKGILK